MDRDLEKEIGRIADHVYCLMQTSDHVTAEVGARDPHDVATPLARTLHLACKQVHGELRDLKKELPKEV
jgi:hypothetical protein